MKYRSDIDGLRAIAVLSVVLFHSGISFVSGGYVGVDVFFVISGYLITTILYKEIQQGKFSFLSFYKRRVARLIPALMITLLVVLLFGFVFYSNKQFDHLGKELFFSSLGAANILFAEGVNYFALNEAYQPLIHLWSLGVEEQFYVIWPIILLLVFRFSPKAVLITAIILFYLSLWFSVSAVNQNLTQGYFLLHYRAFELLVGVITALLIAESYQEKIPGNLKQALSYIGFGLFIIPMFMLDEHSSFPGFNALIPTVGAALVIAFPNDGLVNKILSNKVFILIGLISYPLYLYHQPIISFISFFQVDLSPVVKFLIVFSVSALFAWLTYKYIEGPIRKAAHSESSKKSYISMSGLVATIPLVAIVGFFITQSENLDARFKLLNPFALEVSEAHKQPFPMNFEEGYKVNLENESKVLFVGDSVLQHYVDPITHMLGLEAKQVDTVTLGGCVLLKGVDYKNKFSGLLSCNDLREQLYTLKNNYDYIFISQAWEFYDDDVTNFDKSKGVFDRWQPFLDSTLAHFSKMSDNIIVIGDHLAVEGTLKTQASIMINKSGLSSDLKNIKLLNENKLKESVDFFNQYAGRNSIQAINPYDIFCENGNCVTSDGEWSYFNDDVHLSVASNSFVEKRIKSLLKKGRNSDL